MDFLGLISQQTGIQLSDELVWFLALRAGVIHVISNRLYALRFNMWVIVSVHRFGL